MGEFTTARGLTGNGWPGSPAELVGPKPVAMMLKTSAGRAGLAAVTCEKSLACSTSGPDPLLRMAGGTSGIKVSRKLRVPPPRTLRMAGSSATEAARPVTVICEKSGLPAHSQVRSRSAGNRHGACGCRGQPGGGTGRWRTETHSGSHDRADWRSVRLLDFPYPIDEEIPGGVRDGLSWHGGWGVVCGGRPNRPRPFGGCAVHSYDVRQSDEAGEGLRRHRR
jgi:hypothetical protein